MKRYFSNVKKKLKLNYQFSLLCGDASIDVECGPGVGDHVNNIHIYFFSVSSIKPRTTISMISDLREGIGDREDLERSGENSLGQESLERCGCKPMSPGGQKVKKQHIYGRYKTHSTN
jgi:hypothetical protein